jgi:Tfp pilus assembly pilus retraction ATPase PilT
MAKIDAFFKLMNDQGASDLHLAAGQPPALRIEEMSNGLNIKFSIMIP